MLGSEQRLASSIMSMHHVVPSGYVLHWGWWNPVVDVLAWPAGGLWPLSPKGVVVVVSLLMLIAHQTGRGIPSQKSLGGGRENRTLHCSDWTNTMWLRAYTSANEALTHISVRNIAALQEKGYRERGGCLVTFIITISPPLRRTKLLLGSVGMSP